MMKSTGRTTFTPHWYDHTIAGLVRLFWDTKMDFRFKKSKITLRTANVKNIKKASFVPVIRMYHNLLHKNTIVLLTASRNDLM